MSDVSTHLVQDASERVLTVLRVQDCEPIIENNKRLASEPQTKTDGMKHVASIPNVILEQWLIETGLPSMNDEFWEFAFRRVITDPDWKHLKTA